MSYNSYMTSGSLRLLVRQLSILAFLLFYFGSVASAEVEAPDRRYLFHEDKIQKDLRRAERKVRKAREKSSAAQSTSGQLPFDIDAPNINYDASGNVVTADGGLNITYQSSTIQSNSGSVNVAEKSAELSGDVRISDATAKISADKASMNLNTGEGRLENADVFFEDGEYRLRAKEMRRLPGDVYELDDADLSTCNCPTGEWECFWSLDAGEAKVQRNGYGQAWNTLLRVNDVPVFYFPYLIFPAKTDRQTGFLPPSIGSGNRSGFKLDLPFFWAIDESTDATITPLIETNTRVGSSLEFRKIFSVDHSLETSVLYLDETARDGDLQGTNVSGLADPELDTQRFAGYWNQSLQGRLGQERLQLIVNGKYISDDLLLREFENEKIAPYNSRFVTSTAVLRTSLFDTYSLDLSSEYNQSLVSDDDFVFQRLPSLTLAGFNTFRPFGENPYGLKLTLFNSGDITRFDRKQSYTGQRAEIYERAKVPFHFMNYFDGVVEASARATKYDLDETEVLDEDSTLGEPVTFLKESSDRIVPMMTGKVGSVLEKVFDVSDGNIFKEMAELGTWGRDEQVVRLKHTLEPELTYKFVPDVDQSDTPQFDSYDQLARRNVVGYNFMQRIYARYEPRDSYLYGVEEVAPEAKDFGSMKQTTALDPKYSFGFENAGGDEYQQLRRGSVRELASFSLGQTYDIVEAQDNLDPDQSAFSDMQADLTLLPNDHLGLSALTNFDVETRDVSSYGVEAQLFDKRGDQIRTRFSFVEDQVRQLESGLELAVVDNMKLGYYTRFDDLSGQFIENKAGVRFLSSCKCWVFDVALSDKINPNETRLTFNLTLIGLGELGQTFMSKFGNQDGSNY